MVTETAIETPVEADQVPGPEVTEDAPETAVAAPEVEEAAVEEPAQIEPEERRYTQAELDQIAMQAADNAIKYDREQRQSYFRRQADETALKEQEAVALHEKVDTELVRAGVQDEELVKKIVSKVASVKPEIVATAVQAAVVEDLSVAEGYLTAPMRGDTRTFEEWGLTLRQKSIAHTMRQWYDRGRADATGTGEAIPRSELPKLLDAEIARRNAKAREGKTELKHVDGTPSSSPTLASWETRVAHQGEEGHPMMTDTDWRTYRQIRKDNGL